MATARAHAGSLRFCDAHQEPSAADQDRLLRFAALVKNELARSGASLALIARSGTDLQRFGHRYSHAGLSLQASANAPWSVRQLYYACEEGRPRVFDQGLPGFVLGMSDVDEGYVSLVLLPPGEASAALARTALDDGQARLLLAGDYSANAYGFGLRYQNCNQWLAELLALAWGDGVADRPQAQAWLRSAAYVPSPVQVGAWMLLTPFVPWVHGDDHPAEDKAAGVYRVSMPESLGRFVQARVPGAQRIELCHRGGRAVIRRGGDAPIAMGCEAAAGDEVVELT